MLYLFYLLQFYTFSVAFVPMYNRPRYSRPKFALPILLFWFRQLAHSSVYGELCIEVRGHFIFRIKINIIPIFYGNLVCYVMGTKAHTTTLKIEHFFNIVATVVLVRTWKFKITEML